MVATPAMLPRNNPPKRAGGDSYEEFHPYGTTAWGSTAGVTVSLKRYRFTGMERDDETGLQCHGVRYYAAWLGRWTSADPIGLGDGVNRFAYVRGSPVQAIDLSGTFGLPGALIGGLVGTGVGVGIEVYRQWDNPEWDGKRIVAAGVGGGVAGVTTPVAKQWPVMPRSRHASP